jgi:hypothetical protein
MSSHQLVSHGGHGGGQLAQQRVLGDAHPRARIRRRQPPLRQRCLHVRRQRRHAHAPLLQRLPRRLAAFPRPFANRPRITRKAVAASGSFATCLRRIEWKTSCSTIWATACVSFALLRYPPAPAAHTLRRSARPQPDSRVSSAGRRKTSSHSVCVWWWYSWRLTCTRCHGGLPQRHETT